MQVIWSEVSRLVGGNVPKLIGALAILVVGWLVALLASRVVRRLLGRTMLDNRLARWIAGEEEPRPGEADRWIAKGVFYLIMLLVLVAFFQVLGLTVVRQPLNRLLSEVFGYAPKLLGAGLLLLIAWIVASVLRLVASRALKVARLDERLGETGEVAEGKQVVLSKTLAEAVYWLVFLLFLPAVLGALGLAGLLGPVQALLNKVLGFLPSLLAGALILLIGWFVARIVRRIVTNLLAAVGADRLSERVGLASALGKQQLSGLVGLIVYALILIPVIIAALNALTLDAITGPASEMLNVILGAVPRVFGAVLLLAIAYVVGRVVASIITSLLAGAGFNSIMVRLGVGKELARRLIVTPPPGQITPKAGLRTSRVRSNGRRVTVL